jgi:hypothetical protein
MPFVFRYFWFISAAFMLVNIVLLRRRLAVVVANGAATADEVSLLVRGIAVWLVGMPLLCGTIAMAQGWDSPFCAGTLSFGSAAQSMISIIGLSGGVVLLWWIWRGNGAELLARVGPALGQRPVYDRPFSPQLVRLAVTALVLFSIVGSAMNSRMLDSMPEMACHASVPAVQP